VAGPRDMLILSAGHAQFPRDMLNFRGKGWACGGYVQGSGRAESMSREPWAGLGQSGDMHILVWATQGAYSFLPGACSFISGSTGRRGQAPGTCSIFAARSGHMGDKSRLRRVRRACPLGCGLGWANSGACSFLAGPTLEHAHSCQGQPSFIADSIGASGPTREHAQFSRQGVGIWGICPGLGVCGGHVPWALVLAGPIRGHAHCCRRTCPFIAEGSGPARGTCSFITPKPGHRGYMSGPWRVGRACPAVTRRRLLMPARGHRILPTAEEGPQ
jgi:hypothetical protein